MTTLVEPIKQMAETKMAGGLITKVKQDYFLKMSDHESNHDFYLQDSSDHKGIHDGLPGDGGDFHRIKSSVAAII